MATMTITRGAWYGVPVLARATMLVGTLLIMATSFGDARPRVTGGGKRAEWARGSAVWKPNTHIFAANKALADARADGKVTIPPYGEIPVNANVLRALRSYPTAYRAGVVGPDVFPDIWVGQSLIHVDHADDITRWISDDWLRQIFHQARSWRAGADRDRAVAYAYGFLTHASGDMFAHTYVNHKVGGAWDWTKWHTVTAHVVLESYVGKHTPQTDLTIEVWPRFVSEALIKGPTVRAHSKLALHYATWLDLAAMRPPGPAPWA